MAKNCTFTIQTLGATDLKLGMHTRLDVGSNMGCFYLTTPLSIGVHGQKCNKKQEKKFLKNTWTEGIRSAYSYIFGIGVACGMVK